MYSSIARPLTTIALALYGTLSMAQQFDVTVTIENLAPNNGTSQTPHWVGFHDGDAFDIYNAGDPASALPIHGSVALERLAEDGNNDPITADFATLQPLGVQGTIAGPNGPIGPGEITSMTFRLDATDHRNAFFSYGSMVLPSNDFFYANANPQAHPVFKDGIFIAKDFIIGNQAVRDAGTEVNDELENTTAFFSQSTPNTGTDENSVVVTIGDDPHLVRFSQNGRILSEPRFAMADFSIPNFPLVKISFSAVEVDLNPQIIAGPAHFLARLDQDQEVPPVQVKTNASGIALYVLNKRGDRIRFKHLFRDLTNVTMAHVHMGEPGEAGPVVVDLIDVAGVDLDKRKDRERVTRILHGKIEADDLVGPLAGQPLSALTQGLIDGSLYVNIHSAENPSGEIRGQLEQLVGSGLH